MAKVAKVPKEASVYTVTTLEVKSMDEDTPARSGSGETDGRIANRHQSDCCCIPAESRKIGRSP